MNKIVTVGLGAAAVIVAVFIGAQLFGSPSGGVGGPTDEPTQTSEPTATPEPPPSTSGDGSLPEGPYALTGAVTVTIPGPGWSALPQFDVLYKDDDSDPPDGAGLIGEFTNVYVPADPCSWESTLPSAPASTVDDVVEALANQPSRDASAPEDITMGGLNGRKITLHVPVDVVFGDCDQGQYCSLANGTACERSHQGQGLGQIDEFWVVDVNGEVAVMDGMYGPETPQDDIEEIHAILESATFSE